jgi:predicted nucleotidyltransferase
MIFGSLERGPLKVTDHTDSTLNLIDEIVKWAQSHEDIFGVLLVGSYAQNKATLNSDIDLMFFVSSIDAWITNQDWLASFGKIKKVKLEDWGVVKTLRTFYDGDHEIEFNITTPAWASITPIEANTFRVISDGSKILHDPRGILANLVSAVSSSN